MRSKVYEAIPVNHEGKTFVGFWDSYVTRTGEESHEKFLTIKEKPPVVDMEEFVQLYEEGLVTSGDPEDDIETIADKIREYGIRRVQEDLGIIDPTDEKEIALTVIQKAWHHEYIGQAQNSYYFYIRDLARIMMIEEHAGKRVFQELERDGKVGANGEVIIPYEDQELEYKRLETQTGHKRIHIEAMGNWRCENCHHIGSEYDEPNDYECESFSLISMYP